MTKQNPRKRPYSHVTRSRFLHLEDALDIGKIRLFAGEYRKGNGASATAHHFLDLDDARVLLADLSWGKKVEFTDYKGTSNDNGPQSRVLKIKSNGDKVWFEIQNGPGEIIGKGAVKPKGKPATAVSIPLTVWESRKLAHAALAYIRAWESAHLLDATPTGPLSALPAQAGDRQAVAADGDSQPADGRGSPAPPVTTASPVVTETPAGAAPPVTTHRTEPSGTVPAPMVTELANQVGAPVTTVPEVFASPGEAMAWGFHAGAFKAMKHAANAYRKLKAEKKPTTAKAMAALWVEDVQRRLTVAAT